MNVFPIILWSALGAAAIHLGIQGFRPTGLPFSKNKRLTGTSAKVLGVFCVLFGLFCFACLTLIIIGQSRRALS